MKALTLWQPWASLVALGVKTIETRSWSTNYRGPLAIHAAARPVGRCTRCNGGGIVAPGSCCDYCGGDGRHELMGAYWDHAAEEPPLGAVLATCVLVDVLPIEPDEDRLLEQWPPACRQIVTNWKGERPPNTPWIPGLSVVGPDGVERECNDQWPYGDYTPGRFAWLLDDIKPVDYPVPARGRQQLWEWGQ